MKRLSSATREALANFGTMFLVNLSYEALQRLKAMGQGATGIWIDSLGIAALFAIFTYVWHLPKSTDDGGTPP